ncbi:MAG: hypothetical protein JRI89_14790 [Deltaproteobacteria bacterium]|nr:hypothetical protein [Deltaproteobacteria bacterium]
MAKLEQLAVEEKNLDAAIEELQLGKVLNGESGKELQALQLRKLDLPAKRKALEKALEKVKKGLLEAAEVERKTLLKDCDKRQNRLKKQQADVLPKVQRLLAELACYAEILDCCKADDLRRHLLSTDLLDWIRGMVHKDVDGFDKELTLAKRRVSAYRQGNLKAKIGKITTERTRLRHRVFTTADVDKWLETGQFPVEPAEPEPFRVTVNWRPDAAG